MVKPGIDRNAAVLRTTPATPIRKLRELLESRLGNGTPLELIEVNPSHPWAKFAGTLPDDPVTEAWEEAMREYRRKKDEEPDIE